MSGDKAAGGGDATDAVENAGEGVDGIPMAEPSADAALLELAKKQRMNTVVKRNVFVALMGADDPESAMDRLIQLNLKVILVGMILHVFVLQY